MEDIKSHQFTIIIQANTRMEAQNIIKSLGIECVANTEVVSTGELYIASISTERHLTDEDYGIIRKDTRIAILYDSDSKLRGKKVLDKIHDVEIRLRTLIMYMPGITGHVQELMKNSGKYLKGYGPGEITKDQLDSIVGCLTLGEMLDFLGMDLSIKKQKNDAVWCALENMINSADDFNDFKRRMKKEMEQRFVWDIISEHILDVPVPWNDVKNTLKSLFVIRNDAAHFHVITNKKEKECLKLVDDILRKTTVKSKVKKADTKKISKELPVYFANFSFLPDIYALAENIQMQLDFADFPTIYRNVSVLNDTLKEAGNVYNMDYLNVSSSLAQGVSKNLDTSLDAISSAASLLQSSLEMIKRTSF